MLDWSIGDRVGRKNENGFASLKRSKLSSFIFTDAGVGVVVAAGATFGVVLMVIRYHLSRTLEEPSGTIELNVRHAEVETPTEDEIAALNFRQRQALKASQQQPP